MNYLYTCTSRLVVQHLYQVSFKSMQGCRRSWEDKLKCVKILSVKDHNSAKNLPNMNYLPTCTSRLVVQHLYQVSFKSMQGFRRSWEDKLKCVKILSFKDHNSAKNLQNMNYFPTCTSRLVVQHPCQVSFKSIQGCRRSWEDKLKCVKILSVKDHNSAKICQTWIISPLALLDLYNVVQHEYEVSFKSMQGCRRSWEDKLWCDGRTEWRTKQTLNAPLPFYGGGIKSKSIPPKRFFSYSN